MPHCSHLLLVLKHRSLARIRFFWKEIGSGSSTAAAVVWTALLQVWRSGVPSQEVFRVPNSLLIKRFSTMREMAYGTTSSMPAIFFCCLIVYYDPDLLPLRQRTGSKILSPTLPGLHPQWPFPTSHSVLSPVERIEQLPKRLGLQMSSASCNLKERGKGI